MSKKRNPQDLTLRNLRALKAAHKRLRERLEKLEDKVHKIMLFKRK